MTYGLTQEVITNTRERFNNCELTYEEAMWFLKFEYEDNKQWHDNFGYAVKDKQIETLVKVLKNEN